MTFPRPQTGGPDAGSTVALPVIGTVRSCGCGAITIGARLVSGDVTTGATIDNIATRIEID